MRKKLTAVVAVLKILSLAAWRLARALVPSARDVHAYVGLLLLGLGLLHSPVPWLAGVVVGLALWYMGVVHNLVMQRVLRNGDDRTPGT